MVGCRPVGTSIVSRHISLVIPHLSKPPIIEKCWPGGVRITAMATAPHPGKIACPHCQGLLKAPSLATGSAVNCPKCGKAFRLGQQAEVAAQSQKPTVQS